MVYSSRFVACVLIDGKPQKELHNGVVPIPFGCNYSLRFRNKNNRRAVVKFTIDGEDVSGPGYIIQPNSHIDIHRHSNKDAMFKFVELDSPEAVDFGKNGPNDGTKGVVVARFYLEKLYKMPVQQPSPWYNNLPPSPNWNPPSPYPIPDKIFLDNTNIPSKIDVTWGNAPKIDLTCGNASQVGPGWGAQNSCGKGMSSGLPQSINYCAQPTTFGTYIPSPTPTPTPLQEGCTVEGERSGQTFSTQYIDLEHDYTTVTLFLKGFSAQSSFVAPARQSYCSNCGAKKARDADKFCGVCGNRFSN
jgi:hypothetical protein